MYDNLNYNIECCEFDDEATLNMWGDTFCSYSISCLESFTEKDWKKLFQELPNKSILWQTRFVDCLINVDDPNQLKALLIMARTENIELFSLVVCTLADFDLSGVEGLEWLYEKTNKLFPMIGDYYKSSIINFLEKKNKVR